MNTLPLARLTRTKFLSLTDVHPAVLTSSTLVPVEGGLLRLSEEKVLTKPNGEWTKIRRVLLEDGMSSIGPIELGHIAHGGNGDKLLWGKSYNRSQALDGISLQWLLGQEKFCLRTANPDAFFDFTGAQEQEEQSVLSKGN